MDRRTIFRDRAQRPMPWQARHGAMRRGTPIRWALLVALVGACVPLAATPANAGADVREELRCLALTIYFEARGEPDQGKIAVGHVVMNRALNELFPRDVCAVVRQGGEKLPYRCQFTWWCDRRSDEPSDVRAWQRSEALARLIYWNQSSDPTGGALWYHTVDVDPPWVEGLNRGPTIGRHVFYYLGGGVPKGSQPRPVTVTRERVPASYRFR